MMPDTNDYEVLGHLGRDGRTADMPVIFLTALGSVDEAHRGLDLAATDYVATACRWTGHQIGIAPCGGREKSVRVHADTLSKRAQGHANNDSGGAKSGGFESRGIAD